MLGSVDAVETNDNNLNAQAVASQNLGCFELREAGTISGEAWSAMSQGESSDTGPECCHGKNGASIRHSPTHCTGARLPIATFTSNARSGARHGCLLHQPGGISDCTVEFDAKGGKRPNDSAANRGRRVQKRSFIAGAQHRRNPIRREGRKAA